MHDSGYRGLFDQPEMVRDLITGFLPEAIRAELDLSELQRINASFIGRGHKKREADSIWKMRYRDRDFYLYLLIEFQSSVDDFMALRMAIYSLLLLQQEVLGSGKGRRKARFPATTLPPVYGLVLYNGKPRWVAPLSLKTLFGDLPDALASIQPDAQYQGLDELHYNGPQAPWDNLTAILMELERAPNDEVLISQLVQNLLPVLRQHGSSQLQNAFEQFINHSVKTAPDQPIRLDDLKEDISMLRENAAEWRKQWVHQGMIKGRLEGMIEGELKGKLEGILEGERKGKLEGERLLLTRQLTRRYGELPSWVLQKLEQATEADLEQLSDAMFDATNLEQLFEPR